MQKRQSLSQGQEVGHGALCPAQGGGRAAGPRIPHTRAWPFIDEVEESWSLREMLEGKEEEEEVNIGSVESQEGLQWFHLCRGSPVISPGFPGPGAPCL